MNETRTKVTVDDSGIDSFFQRVKRDADELGREMIQASRKYSSSSREVLRDIEDQISAIERRNRLDAEFQKSKLTRQYESGAVSPEQFRERATEIRRGTEEDKMQVTLLREMIETIKQTAKEEIREDRKAVEEQIKQSKTVDQLSPEGDPVKNLIETLQRGMLGDVKESEQSDRAKLAGNALVGGFRDIASAKNEVYAAVASLGTAGSAAAAGVGGFVGGLMGGVISSVTGAVRRGLEATERMETARGGMIALTGKKMPEGWFSRIESYAHPFEIGMSYSEFLTAATDYGRSNIRNQKGGTIGALQMEKGLGVDRGILTGLSRTQRGTNENIDVVANTLAGTITRSTKNEESTRAYLGEYLSILTDVNRQQLQVLGRVDSGVNTKMIAALAKVGGGFENPEVLKQVINSVYTGLTTAQTPQVEALQYATLSRLAPGKSLWDLRKMMEDPFSSDYMPEMLKSMISISGSKDDAMFNVQSWLGLSGKMTEDLVNAVLGGKINSLKDVTTTVGYNLREEGDAAVGEQARRSARYRGWFEKQGTRFFDLLEDDDRKGGFRPPEPTQEAAYARSKEAREGSDAGRARMIELETRIVMLERSIKGYEDKIKEGQTLPEVQQKFYERLNETLTELKSQLEENNRSKRRFNVNTLKEPALKNIWD